MPHFEQFKKDELSREAQELFAAHKKNEIAQQEREGRILYEAQKAHEHILWLLKYGVISKNMPIGDVLGLLDETVKEINEKFKRE